MSGSSSESGDAIIRACASRGDGASVSKVDLRSDRVEPVTSGVSMSGQVDPHPKPLPSICSEADLFKLCETHRISVRILMMLPWVDESLDNPPPGWVGFYLQMLDHGV